MTSPNPSPELRALVQSFLISLTGGGRNAINTLSINHDELVGLLKDAERALSQTLPAPGEVGEGFRCHNCKFVVSGHRCPTRCPECRCRDFSAIDPPTAATVAAANDEGVAALREPIARLVKPDNWHWHDRFMREADEAKFDGQANHKREEAARQVDTSLAVADQIIRLLSQGEGK